MMRKMSAFSRRRIYLIVWIRGSMVNFLGGIQMFPLSGFPPDASVFSHWLKTCIQLGTLNCYHSNSRCGWESEWQSLLYVSLTTWCLRLSCSDCWTSASAPQQEVCKKQKSMLGWINIYLTKYLKTATNKTNLGNRCFNRSWQSSRAKVLKWTKR